MNPQLDIPSTDFSKYVATEIEAPTFDHGVSTTVLECQFRLCIFRYPFRSQPPHQTP